MTNHTHLLVTPHYPDSISELMKRLGQRYTQYFNKNYRRSGTLWEGRFRSCIVQQDSYVLYCYRYIELNPVRASMVKHPAEYPWSSYRVNAQSDPSGLITPHTTYSSLGQTETDRVVAYRHLFAERLDDGVIDDIRDATNGNLVVGCDQFKKDVELSLGRRVFPRRAGRPPKSGSDPN